MKHSLVYLAGMLLVAGASKTFAASSQDLSVTGTIIPDSCTPTLPGGGSVSFGRVSVQDLEPSGVTYLPAARMQLTVTCSGKMLVAIKTLDNRAGSVSGHMYGLGLAANGARIGGYTLTTENATGDGVPRAMIETTYEYDAGGWMEAEGMGWQPKWLRTLNGGTGGALYPLALQTLQVDVVVKPQINDKSTLPIASEVQGDGSALLSLVYL